jgi:hypothetical protein
VTHRSTIIHQPFLKCSSLIIQWRAHNLRTSTTVIMYTGLAISLLLALASSVSGKQTVLRGNPNDQKVRKRALKQLAGIVDGL